MCRSESWSPIYEVLLECQECGFVRARLDPDPGDLQRLYSGSYFRGDEYADYLAERSVHRKNFERRWERIRSIAGPLESVFEVGCAYGLWLEFLSERGVRCAGVDISSEAVEYAVRELDQEASDGDFSTVPIEVGDYQAYVLWDTIEHLADPAAVVEKIVRLLPPGGWLFLTTGDLGSRNARRRGARWRMIHPPTHLQYFSQDTMTRFLGRFELDVSLIESHPIYRNLRGTLANLEVLGRGGLRAGAGLARRVVPDGLQERVGLWLDLGDIMFVAARKGS